MYRIYGAALGALLICSAALYGVWHSLNLRPLVAIVSEDNCILCEERRRYSAERVPGSDVLLSFFIVENGALFGIPLPPESEFAADETGAVLTLPASTLDKCAITVDYKRNVAEIYLRYNGRMITAASLQKRYCLKHIRSIDLHGWRLGVILYDVYGDRFFDIGSEDELDLIYRDYNLTGTWNSGIFRGELVYRAP